MPKTRKTILRENASIESVTSLYKEGNAVIMPVDMDALKGIVENGKAKVRIQGVLDVKPDHIEFIPNRPAQSRLGIQTYRSIMEQKGDSFRDRLYVTEDESVLVLRSDRAVNLEEVAGRAATLLEMLMAENSPVKMSLEEYCDELRKCNDEARKGAEDDAGAE